MFFLSLLLKLGLKMFKLNGNSDDPTSKLRGPGYVVLNVIRVLNIISLITVAIASWVMLVKTVMTSNVCPYPHRITFCSFFLCVV